MTPFELARVHGAAFAPSSGWSEAEFETLLSNETTVLATVEGAFVLGRLILDEAEVLTVATDPQRQRQGLAGRALDLFHQHLEARGAARAFLEVAEDNVAAQALYRAAGYWTASRRRGYYRRSDGTRIDALLMTRSFAP